MTGGVHVSVANPSASRVNGVLSYSLADHLGSTVQQISGGTPGTAIKYFPFGAPRNGTGSLQRA